MSALIAPLSASPSAPACAVPVPSADGVQVHGGSPTARVVADIGGTHARFAWQGGPGGPLLNAQVLACARYPSLLAAAQAYWSHCHAQCLATPVAMAVAIAAPVGGDVVHMTNHAWSFSQAALCAQLGLERLRVLNDFEALALALPTLAPDELRPLGGGIPRPGATKALLGAGTGLGVSGLVPTGQAGAAAWVALPGEGGHVTLPAATAQERWLMDCLAQRHGHVSAERVLCGQGLWDTYALMCEASGAAVACADAAAVSTSAMARTDAHAHEALTLWCGLLGSVAGNLALTLGAQGGVYVGGGIVPRLGAWMESSPFRARFEDKGRYRAYLQAIPVWVITSPQSPALQGAAQALDGC